MTFISLKVEKPNTLKFCIFTSIICTIISTKFQINPSTVTLFSGSGPKSPPPPPVAGEISKCRRLLSVLRLTAMCAVSMEIRYIHLKGNSGVNTSWAQIKEHGISKRMSITDFDVPTGS